MWVCISSKTEWSLSRVQMTACFVTLLWGSDKNPALSTKDTGQEMLKGMLHWDFSVSGEAASGILCSGCWTSERHLISFFWQRGQRTLIIENLPKWKPTGCQSLWIPLKPQTPGSAWLHFNVFLMCLGLIVDISLQRNLTRHWAS